MAPQPGTLLGRYRLIEKAGVGGMSEVWKAEDTTLHRTVAVKVILTPVAEDPTYRERFLREARLVAGLEHPNVLPVYDFGTQTVEGAEVSYLVMPLVLGGSLKGHITGPMPYGIAVAWLQAVSAALDHAHAKGILHRDVKPGNVLLDSQGRPLLADFGLARSSESISGLTQTGTVLGTPLYMAPEQAMGGTLDGRADQYALAVIAFEILTGLVPFRADSPLAVLHQHVSVPPPPASSIIPAIPPAADAVLSKALAKKPADRFPSCSAFVEALAGALGVPLVPVSGAPAASPVTRPTVVGAAAPADESGAATVVSGGGPGAKARLAAPASVPPPPPAPAPAAATPSPAPPTAIAPPRKTSGTRVLLLAAVVLVGLGLVAVVVTKLRAPKSAEETSLPPTPLPTAVPTALPQAPEPATAQAEAPPPTPAAPAGPRVAEARPSAPRERARPEAAPRLPRPAPLLGGAGLSGDTRLEEAYRALDNSKKTRLTREDFVDAMGAARTALATNPSREVKVLDAFSRAGVSFADGNNAQAWQLLNTAFNEAPGLARGRVLGFVDRQMRMIGPNPGLDGNWVLALAFCDVRGDLGEELEKATQRAPGNARVRYARALAAWQQGHAAEAVREARTACDAGLSEACDLLK
ncbi:MAG TPA: protein kinase [Thermoanaerobaculia bacterium]|nr:protein kinase [Thermoanaerobaculia bacterium]